MTSFGLATRIEIPFSCRFASTSSYDSVRRLLAREPGAEAAAGRALALLGLHVRERGDAHDMRDLRDAAGAGELVVDGGGAAAVLRLIHEFNNNDALRVQRLREHGPRVGLFVA